MNNRRRLLVTLGTATAATPVFEVFRAETGTVQEKDQDIASVDDFGVLPSASAATNGTQLAVAIAAAKAGGKGLRIPAGTYNYDTKIVIAGASASGMRVVADGKVILHFTGTGNAVELGNDRQNTWDVHFGTEDNPIFVEGTVNTATAVLCTAFHHGSVWVKVWNCVKGLWSKWAVCTKYGVTCSESESVSQVLRPTNGIVLDEMSAGNYTAACIIENPIIESVRGTGIVLASGSFNQIIGGTSEGNDIGLTIAASCRLNKIIGTDYETNSTCDVRDAGTGNSHIGCNGKGGGRGRSLQIIGRGNCVFGGFYALIDINSSSAGCSLYGVSWAHGYRITGGGDFSAYGCFRIDDDGLYVDSFPDQHIGESGTFAPTLNSASGSFGTQTITGASVVSGKIRHACARISVAKGTASGPITMALSVPARNIGVDQWLNVSNWVGLTLGAGYTNAMIRIRPNTATGELLKRGTGVATAAIVVADFSGDVIFEANGSYQTV